MRGMGFDAVDQAGHTRPFALPQACVTEFLEELLKRSPPAER